MSLVREAEDLFRGALARVDVGACISAHVRCEGAWLRVDEQGLLLSAYRRIGVIAMGKAALSMSAACSEILEANPGAAARLEGVVVSGSALSASAQPRAGLRYFVGGHPLPTRGSQDAADAILAFVAGFGPDDLLMYLISGGASAMVERASLPGFSFQDTVELYRALLHSGLPIRQMNCVRKHTSAVKGGRLAVAANGATQISLLVSDVPGEDLSVIGSGPSMPDPSTADECKRVLEALSPKTPAQARLLQRLRESAIVETPKPGDPAFARSLYTCVLSPSDLVHAARVLATDAGYHVEVDSSCDDWDCAEAAMYLLRRLHDLRAQYGRVCLLSSGELSVRLPADPGLGGRNQHFALACALQLRGYEQATVVLSAGTDGQDGNSPAAGAVVSEKTCSLAAALGMNAQDFYERFDSYSLFHTMDTAIVTGPTENNLRDLRILLAE